MAFPDVADGFDLERAGVTNLVGVTLALALALLFGGNAAPSVRPSTTSFRVPNSVFWRNGNIVIVLVVISRKD